MEPKPKLKKGFAVISPERRREIASLGGKAAQAKGTGHRYNSDEARLAGLKGGKASAEKRRLEKSLPTEPAE